MPSKHRVTINVSEADYQMLNALAEKHRVAVAWLGRQAIIEFLERHQQENVQLPFSLPSSNERTGSD